MLFFVKVRVDVDKLVDLGQRLQAGAIQTHPVITYCLKEDPSIGLNIWEAEDREAFEKAFAPHREYYSEVMETVPVITPQEAQKILMEQMAGK
ncbi:MAG: hypothetical protein JXB07_12140 [Anaerolineae bacterium]|nr:hypothetical protein [Anaerolineae bacterium]